MSALESFLSSDPVRAFGMALLHSMWQGLIIALAAVIILMILRRYSPKLRYLVLFILLLLIPVTFTITFFLNYNTGNISAGPGGDTAMNAASPLPATEAMSLAYDENTAWYEKLMTVFESNAHWLFLLWFTGFIIFLLKFTGSLLYVYRIKNYRVFAASGPWQARAEKLSASIGLRKAVRLLESALVKVPMTIGYLKPVILVPLGTLSSVPPQQIEAIILHELAHIYRRDYVLNMIQSLVEMLFFYHPVTWWLSGLIRMEREHICDDIALSVHHDRINYIKALTTMEEMNVKSPVLATALTGPRKKLLHRVKRLVQPDKIKRGIAEGIVSCFLLAGLVLAISANALTYAKSNASDPTVNYAGAVLPTAYDLSGGESGEKITNLLPMSFVKSSVSDANDQEQPDRALSAVVSADPDTIITKSGSGKVIVKVIKDTSDTGKEKEMQVIVESWEDSEADREANQREFEKYIVIDTGQDLNDDSLISVIRIRDGDSVRVISRKIDMEGMPHGEAFHWEAMPPIPGVPEMPEFYFHPDDRAAWEELNRHVFVFKNDSIDTAFIYQGPGHFEYHFDGKEFEQAQKEFELQMKEFEFNQQEFEKGQQEMERELRKAHIYAHPQQPVPSVEWYSHAPAMPDQKTEKVIRQELRDDGLISHGRSYIIEIGSRGMYINGEKQPKDVAKKYMHLVEGLEPGMLDDSGTFKLVF